MENTDEKTTEQNTESVNVVTENVSTEENQTELDKAKALEDKTNEELAAAQETLANAMEALPEAAEGLLASARSALEADLNLIQEEIKSRTDQAVDTVRRQSIMQDPMWIIFGVNMDPKSMREPSGLYWLPSYIVCSFFNRGMLCLM